MRALLIVSGLVGLVACCGSAPIASAHPRTWGDDTDKITQRAEYAHSKAVCRALRDLQPPTSDRPSPDDFAALGGCNSGSLYYGIGVEPDPVQARKCAFIEQGGDERPFAGAAMLMTIYANGVGAKRDLDVATALACMLDGAPAEIDGRVDHLQQLKAHHWAGHDLDYCDDITSGIASGFCAELAASIEASKRAATLAELARGWPERDRQAYATLSDAETAYATASSENEVDLSGTARVAFMIEREQSIDTAFLKLIQALANGTDSTVTTDDMVTAHDELAKTFDRVMAARDPIWGTVEKAGIRTTQKVWNRYRDAWLAFAEIRYDQAASDRIRMAVTLERIDTLKELLD